MKGRFAKGFCYIVKSGTFGGFYIVRQIGQRSWVAVEFTHLGINEKNRLISGNSIYLWEVLNPTKYKFFPEVAEAKKEFRKEMFNVLKYGKFIEWEV